MSSVARTYEVAVCIGDRRRPVLRPIRVFGGAKAARKAARKSLVGFSPKVIAVRRVSDDVEPIIDLTKLGAE